METPAAPALAEQARAKWGDEAVRPPHPSDAIGPIVPALVLEPGDAERVAEMLAWADGHRLGVVIRGRGTKRTWGAQPGHADLVLSLARLVQPIEHCAGDLTATVAAGATLDEVNTHLAGAGQWLPLDPWAGGACSIGGLLATNDSGPRRLRYGAPRDLVIGIEMVLACGQRAKSGGRVVKNVAGYDLGRLLTGSYGSLAAITSATFKLAPLPTASRTVAAHCPHAAGLAALAQAVAASPMTPSAVELEAPSLRLLVRVESTVLAATEQVEQVRDLCATHGATATILSGPLETDAWTAYHTPAPELRDALLKITALPSALESVLAIVDREARARALAWRLNGRATLGVLHCQVGGAPLPIVGFVLKLRELLAPMSGHVAVLLANPTVKAAVPPWGDLGHAARVARAVKAQFDPHGTLCPGGGPGGLV